MKSDKILTSENKKPLLPTTGKLQLWCLIALFCIGLWLTSMFVLLIKSESRGTLLTGAVVQDILAFITPALLCGWLFTRCPLKWVGLTKPFSGTLLLGVFAVFVFSLPCLNWIVTVNESMTLPKSLAGVEEVFRNLENQASQTTAILLHDTSITGLISGILIIGLLGPFCEEVFFRGALQRTLYGIHPWKAVWWTALIFSLLHFQMYGFVPRFLLGLWFGYLYLWSGKLWPSVFAHALNNTITVISQWLITRGDVKSSYFEIGSDGNLIIVAISILFSALIIFLIRKRTLNSLSINGTEPI